MYRFQYDGRLQRSTETAVMLMETFDRLSRKEKYVWDVSLFHFPRCSVLTSIARCVGIRETDLTLSLLLLTSRRLTSRRGGKS